MSQENPGSKKILENSPLSGIAVPIAIVLVGALIIFGVTKMLSSGKNHRDLIDEMNSKTFGNRWVAAYELSKFLASSRIPQQDMPWVIENLSKVYRESVDARTRNFVVLALGSLKNPLALPVLNQALEDVDPQVKFNTVVALGNMNPGTEVDWPKLQALVDQNDDMGLKQVSLFTLASHKRGEAEEKALGLLSSSEQTLQFAAATVLIHYKRREALPVLESIVELKYGQSAQGTLNGAQVEGLKMSVLENLEKSHWRELASWVEKIESTDTNVRVSTKAKQVLKVLKN